MIHLIGEVHWTGWMACQASASDLVVTALLLPLTPALLAMLLKLPSKASTVVAVMEELSYIWTPWSLLTPSSAWDLHPRWSLAKPSALWKGKWKQRAGSRSLTLIFQQTHQSQDMLGKVLIHSGIVIYWGLWLIFTCRFSHWDAQPSHNSKQGWTALGKFTASVERIHPSGLKCLCMNQSWIFLPGWSFHL